MIDRLEPGVLLYGVEYPERSSRWLIFVRWLLAIPHFFILYFFGMVVGVTTFIAWFAILFTGRYPRGLWDFAVAYHVWTANVMAYFLFQRDEYPPFGTGEYPVRFDLVYPERLSRLLIFVKFLLIIPHYFVLVIIGTLLYFAVIVAWFAILILGRYPEGLFNFVTGVQRWWLRVNAYVNLLTDRYPPFSMG
jgi:hypothetical protein